MGVVGGTGHHVGRITRLGVAGTAVDVDVVDEVRKVHRTEERGEATAGVVVRLVEDQVTGVVGEDRRNDTLARVRGRTGQRDARLRPTAVRSSRVEALELGVEVLVPQLHQRLGERLVEGVVADHPRIVAEVPRHLAPHHVELTLQVAHHVVVPEVLVGDASGGGGVLERPTTGRIHAGHPIGTDRPIRRALAVEQLVVDVLVHVEDGEDVITAEEIDRSLEPGQVAIEHRPIELMRVTRVAGAADGGVVGRQGARLEPTPGHAEPDDAEAQPGDQGRVVGIEVPRFTRIGIDLEGRMFVHHVDPVEDDDTSGPIGEEGTTVCGQRTLYRCVALDRRCRLESRTQGR